MWKKWPSENPQRHRHVFPSAFSTASIVHSLISALSKAPSGLKGLFLGQERCQSLHASSACVLLREHAVEHCRSSIHQCEVKTCPAEVPEAPFMLPFPRCPHAQRHCWCFNPVTQALVFIKPGSNWTRQYSTFSEEDSSQLMAGPQLKSFI